MIVVAERRHALQPSAVTTRDSKNQDTDGENKDNNSLKGSEEIGYANTRDEKAWHVEVEANLGGACSFLTVEMGKNASSAGRFAFTVKQHSAFIEKSRPLHEKCTSA
jgi:hypothetical protein